MVDTNGMVSVFGSLICSTKRKIQKKCAMEFTISLEFSILFRFFFLFLLMMLLVACEVLNNIIDIRICLVTWKREHIIFVVGCTLSECGEHQLMQ